MVCGCMIIALNTSAEKLSFVGNHDPVIEIIPEKSTGLNKIFVLKDLKGVSVYIDDEEYYNAKWSIFGNMGAAYSMPLNNILYEGKKSTLSTVSGNKGYIIESSDKKYTFWIVDYSTNQFGINKIDFDDIQDCESTVIDFDGSASPIYYYTINGRQEVLSRDIKLLYNNLVWNEDYKRFEQQSLVKNLSSISDRLIIIPPLYCISNVHIIGDRFLEFWNTGKSYVSRNSNLYSVSVETNVTSLDVDNVVDNEIKDNVDFLGGSAPCTLLFSSYVTDGVDHIEWQMSDDIDFKNILYRVMERDFEYTFTEGGIKYVRCVGSNVDGNCVVYGKTYTVNIGTSELKIPNIFSPDGDGINDEWKVAYRSILSYQCRIFDRHGHELFYCDNPAIGWNGRYKNKLVKPGVYYYVINAVGSDGKHYKKRGDINIVFAKDPGR